jgi:two-component system sensor histidine kinase BaeS
VQRRLSATIIGVVAGAIILTGVVTFALAAHAARHHTQSELTAQAEDVAQAIKTEISSGRNARNLLGILRAPFKDENDFIVVVTKAGQLINVDQPGQKLPFGFGPAQLPPASLLAGQVVSGSHGGVVYAAAPYQSKLGAAASVTQVVVLTRSPDTGLREALPWFVLAAAVVLLIAAVVGDRLGRRITRPLRAAEAVTRQIAAGDLAAQVPLPHRGDPELASLAASINTMAETLARSKGMERQFLMSVSHDLRTPLTSIRGFAEAIAEGAAPDNQRAAEVIASEARRLERLVKDLLDLARVDVRRFSLDLRPVDVSEVVCDTGEGFRPQAEELGLRLEFQAGPARAIGAWADPDRLAQVVANLVENALKYARGQVVVGVAATEHGAVIWVDDDGPGIAPEDLPQVFDRLFVSSRRPARQVGTGLGLAIVAELVSAMGGTVRAESPTVRGGGTRMVVTLPPSTPGPAPPTTSTGPTSTSLSSSPQGRW